MEITPVNYIFISYFMHFMPKCIISLPLSNDIFIISEPVDSFFNEWINCFVYKWSEDNDKCPSLLPEAQIVCSVGPIVQNIKILDN